MGINFGVQESFTSFRLVSYVNTSSPCYTTPKSFIDKNGDRAFRQQLEKRLKSQMTDGGGTCRIKKVAMETSHSNNLLQLADMVCGAVMRSYTVSDSTFRGLVKKREKFVQLWPRP